jgi:hypothetical protein
MLSTKTLMSLERLLQLDTLAPTGLHIGGTKYMAIQGEAGVVIRGKKV